MWPLMRVPLGPAPGFPDGGLQAEADRVLATATEVAREVSADLDVHPELITGSPQSVLARASEKSDLVVVGDRGLGGFTGMIIGSVAVAMAQRATCPVVVVRGHESPEGPVVVGVDGSAADDAVLAAAAERAVRWRTTLRIVHAWEIPVPLTPVVMTGTAIEQLAAVAREIVEQAVHRSRLPADLEIDERVVAGSAVGALVEASREARIVVVGSRGVGALRGLVAGSVCHGVVYQSTCPVVVVRV
jgi:nucleotide-binding universal stress UspA family protein